MRKVKPDEPDVEIPKSVLYTYARRHAVASLLVHATIPQNEAVRCVRCVAFACTCDGVL